VSTPARAPRVPKEEARDRIRDAAANLLTHSSYRDLSVDAVMAEAGLARTLFYRHFDGLPALMLSLLDDLRDALLSGGEPGDPEFLRRVLERAVDVARRHGPLLRAIDDAARHDAEVERAYDAFVEWSIQTTAAIFREGVATGKVRAVPDVDATVRALTRMNGGFLIDQFARDPDFDPQVPTDVLWTIWARTLGID
jgi:AcrR family transcriptional regulator